MEEEEEGDDDVEGGEVEEEEDGEEWLVEEELIGCAAEAAVEDDKSGVKLSGIVSFSVFVEKIKEKDKKERAPKIPKRKKKVGRRNEQEKKLGPQPLLNIFKRRFHAGRR